MHMPSPFIFHQRDLQKSVEIDEILTLTDSSPRKFQYTKVSFSELRRASLIVTHQFQASMESRAQEIEKAFMVKMQTKKQNMVLDIPQLVTIVAEP
jgi:hypothetical protein